MNTVFLERICRCCLNESDDVINLFDRVTGIEQFTFEEHFTYFDLIFLCTNVRCDLDIVGSNEHIVELPQNMCETCLQELRTSFLFRQKCESSNNLLREQTTQTGNDDENIEYNQISEAKIGDKNHKNIIYDDNDKETLLNEKCVFINKEKPILITINEHTELENKSNEVEVHIVSIASHERELLPSTSEQLDTEFIRSEASSSFLCKICTKYFNSESELQVHNRQQHQDEKYLCSDCPKKFHTENKLLTHIATHSIQSNKRKFLCSKCGKFFSTKHRLKEHAAQHTGEKNHACNECDKKFSSESRLRCHRRTHTGEKPYRCDLCDLTFAQGNALRCHKRIHTGEKPYECRFCNKRFTQNTILKTHMTLHTGKTIKCPDCDKMFSRASNLILHRREHTGEKPYACNRCPNRYKQKSHLDRHMDTHLGVKHTCEICQKDYSKRWSLKVHMFSHSKDKPHRCPICKTGFARRDKFKNHLKSIHSMTSIDIQNYEI